MSEHPDGVTLADVAYSDTWGKYAPAITRAELVAGRPAPAPTEDGKLSPRFVEWMMLYPEGWITGLGISRTGQLRALGNAIVPLQAAKAWGSLLGLGDVTTHTHTPAPDATDQRHERSREPRRWRTGPEDGGDVSLIPTPTAWLGRRPAHAKGDPARWTDPDRSNELSDFIAALSDEGGGDG
jgi:hypothetical protein